MSNLSANDMVFYKEGEQIMSGGFSVDSILLKNNDSKSNFGGGGMSNIFKDLAVPAGLLYQPSYATKKKFFKYEEHDDELEGGFRQKEVLPENIHDVLLKMIEHDNNKKSKNERKSKRLNKDKKEKKNVSKKNKKNKTKIINEK